MEYVFLSLILFAGGYYVYQRRDPQRDARRQARRHVVAAVRDAIVKVRKTVTEPIVNES